MFFVYMTMGTISWSDSDWGVLSPAMKDKSGLDVGGNLWGHREMGHHIHIVLLASIHVSQIGSAEPEGRKLYIKVFESMPQTDELLRHNICYLHGITFLKN